MDLQAWLMLITQIMAAYLKDTGQFNNAGLLSDALAAVHAGKNVDDVMREIAAKWAQEGEPSFNEIAAARQKIQERIGA